MNVIDAHVHLGEGLHLQLTVDELLRLMDEADVAVAVGCAVDRCLAVDNEEGNDQLLAAMREHPDRIVGMASANPWFGGKAAAELRRALGEGLVGVILHPFYQGFRPTDPLVNPLVEVAAEFDVPVYVPTGTAGIAEPFHVVELARRFPGVEFIMGHAGASDYYLDAVRALEFAENLWLESSRNGPGNYQLFEMNSLLDRLIFGSGAPEYIPAVEADVIRDTLTDEKILEAIFRENIRRIFKGRLPS